MPSVFHPAQVVVVEVLRPPPTGAGLIDVSRRDQIFQSRSEGLESTIAAGNLLRAVRAFGLAPAGLLLYDNAGVNTAAVVVVVAAAADRTVERAPATWGCGDEGRADHGTTPVGQSLSRARETVETGPGTPDFHGPG